MSCYCLQYLVIIYNIWLLPTISCYCLQYLIIAYTIWLLPTLSGYCLQYLIITYNIWLLPTISGYGLYVWLLPAIAMYCQQYPYNLSWGLQRNGCPNLPTLWCIYTIYNSMCPCNLSDKTSKHYTAPPSHYRSMKEHDWPGKLWFAKNN